ncbi:hypothetical protein QQ045_032736 [Rhodiola kirilowii]
MSCWGLNPCYTKTNIPKAIQFQRIKEFPNSPSDVNISQVVLSGRNSKICHTIRRIWYSQRDIIIDCTGFQSAANLNPADLNQIDEHQCKLNDGRYIDGQESVTFIYSWYKPYNFKPLTSTIACG